MYLLAAAAAATAAPTDWASIFLSAGVAGAVLFYLFAKFIPDQQKKHAEERAELRADFLGALEKIEKRSERREAAMNEQLQAERTSRERFFGESTAMGNAQAAATLRLSESMNRLSAKLDDLLERIRHSTTPHATTEEDLKAWKKRVSFPWARR